MCVVGVILQAHTVDMHANHGLNLVVSMYIYLYNLHWTHVE